VAGPTASTSSVGSLAGDQYVGAKRPAWRARMVPRFSTEL